MTKGMALDLALAHDRGFQAMLDRLAKPKVSGPIGPIPTLAEFVQQSWHVLEGDSPCDWNWHMDAIAYHCQELFFDWVARMHDENFVQRSRNLLLTVPPGSAKSRIVSVCFPAWAWLHYPRWRVICLSSNPRVALRDSLYCRDLIESDWYTDRFRPSWRLRYDQNTKSLFNNTAGGWRKALGWGSRVTGDRGDCVAEGTMVETDRGSAPIEEIVENPSAYKVLSFNHETGKAEFRQVVAGRKIHNKSTLRIVAGGALEIECTPGHRIYANGDYVPASELRPGDTLFVQGARPYWPIAISTIVESSDRATVYDIQVQGNHNFFANGILVHNCLLADDPHDAEEVSSEAKRQAVLDRWDNAIGNRVNDMRVSCRLGIMQRLKENDWGGHVLREGWDLLSIPQEYEGNDQPTVFGWTDPRSTIGELMFPKRFPIDVVESEKMRLGQGYAGQHQQRPTSAGGGMFKIRSWRLYNPRKLPPFQRSVLSLDCSFKGGQNADYNALAVISETTNYREILLPRTYHDRDGIEHHHVEQAHGYYIRDLWHEKADITGVETALQQFAKDYPEAIKKLIEDKANGPAIIDRLSGVIPGIIPVSPGRASKEERAAAIQPIQSRGDIYLPIDDQYCAALEAMGLDSISIEQWWDLNPPPHETDAEHCPVAPWVKDLINEFAKFPNASNDDIVDAIGQAVIWLQSNLSAIAPGTALSDTRSLAERNAARRSQRPVKARAF